MTDGPVSFSSFLRHPLRTVRRLIEGFVESEFYRSYVVPPSRPPDEEKEFEEYARREAIQLAIAGWSGILSVMGLFWITDFLAFDGTVLWITTKIRVLLVLWSAVFIYGFVRWEPFRSAPSHVTAMGVCGALAVGGYLISDVGGMETFAFDWPFLVPLLTTVGVDLNLRDRALWTVGFVVSCMVGYFGARPEYLQYPYLGSTVEILVIAVIASIVAGQLIHNIFRRSFFRGYDLDQERKRSERLLLNILPEGVAGQLKDENDLIARGYDGATVLFADLVEFTPLADRMDPSSLVMLLDDIISSFDGVIEEFDVEKIKTIGDEYFVVAGVPDPHPNHAREAAELAFALRDETEKYIRRNEEPFEIRIGLNSGPLVAGVIGTDKFVYDVWGDTVNVGSRMESQGKPGKIQVTPSTREILKQNAPSRYRFEERGTMNVKGKGTLETYFLEPNDP